MACTLANWLCKGVCLDKVQSRQQLIATSHVLMLMFTKNCGKKITHSNSKKILLFFARLVTLQAGKTKKSSASSTSSSMRRVPEAKSSPKKAIIPINSTLWKTERSR